MGSLCISGEGVGVGVFQGCPCEYVELGLRVPLGLDCEPATLCARGEGVHVLGCVHYGGSAAGGGRRVSPFSQSIVRPAARFGAPLVLGGLAASVPSQDRSGAQAVGRAGATSPSQEPGVCAGCAAPASSSAAAAGGAGGGTVSGGGVGGRDRGGEPMMSAAAAAAAGTGPGPGAGGLPEPEPPRRAKTERAGGGHGDEPGLADTAPSARWAPGRTGQGQGGPEPTAGPPAARCRGGPGRAPSRDRCPLGLTWGAQGRG